MYVLCDAFWRCHACILLFLDTLGAHALMSLEILLRKIICVCVCAYVFADDVTIELDASQKVEVQVHDDASNEHQHEERMRIPLAPASNAMQNPFNAKRGS